VLSNVALSDLSIDGFGAVNNKGCVLTTLQVSGPGSVATCTVTYAVQPGDYGKVVTLKGRAIGTAPGGSVVLSGPLTSLVSIGVSVPGAAPSTDNPAIWLWFTRASLSRDGEHIDFVFTAENIGNVTLYNVSLTSVSFNGNLPGDPPCTITTLNPGDSTPCPVSYRIKPADRGATITATAQVEGNTVDGGATGVTASASASGPFRVKSGCATTRVPVPKEHSPKNAPSIDLAFASSSLSSDASQITYVFTVTNDGNVALNPASMIQVGFTGAGKPSISCDANKLAPGVSTTCTVIYAVQAADVGTTVTFTGEAQGVTANGVSVKSDDVAASVDVPGAAKPGVPGKPSDIAPTGGAPVGSAPLGLGVIGLFGVALCVLIVRRRQHLA